MFERRIISPSKPERKAREPSNDCDIEIKKTASGKRIRFRGKCTKEQIEFLKQENNIE